MMNAHALEVAERRREEHAAQEEARKRAEEFRAEQKRALLNPSRSSLSSRCNARRRTGIAEAESADAARTARPRGGSLPERIGNADLEVGMASMTGGKMQQKSASATNVAALGDAVGDMAKGGANAIKGVLKGDISGGVRGLGGLVKGGMSLGLTAVKGTLNVVTDPNKMVRSMTDKVLEKTHLSALMGGEDEARYAPKEDSWVIRKRAFTLTHSDRFNQFVIGLILLNTLTLSIETYQQSAAKTSFLAACNIVFTAAFTLEMVLKLVALTPRGYVGAW